MSRNPDLTLFIHTHEKLRGVVKYTSLYAKSK